MNEIKREAFVNPANGPTIYMGENLINPVPDIQTQAILKQKAEEEIKTRKDVLNQELELVKGYNTTIDDFAPCYRTFQPLDDILVRVFLKEPKVSDSGLWLPTHSKSDIIELKRRAGSGDRYTQNIDITPFTFATKAVIVSVPSYLKDDPNFQPGKTVTIAHLKSNGTVLNDDSVIIDYQCSFVHPEYGDVTPPRNFQNEHFGYALIPRGVIKGFNTES